MSKPKPMTWDGIEYPSQAALAEVKGVSPGTVSYWYRCGYTSDDDLFKGTPTVLNGKWYKSRAAAARDNHMTRGGVYSRLATQSEWRKSHEQPTDGSCPFDLEHEEVF